MAAMAAVCLSARRSKRAWTSCFIKSSRQPYGRHCLMQGMMRGVLARSPEGCMQVHASVFAAAEGEAARDARVALAAARRRVLAGVRVCFSAVIPRGTAAPHAHALWRLAQEVPPAHLGFLSCQATVFVLVVTGRGESWHGWAAACCCAAAPCAALNACPAGGNDGPR